MAKSIFSVSLCEPFDCEPRRVWARFEFMEPRQERAFGPQVRLINHDSPNVARPNDSARKKAAIVSRPFAGSSGCMICKGTTGQCN